MYVTFGAYRALKFIGNIIRKGTIFDEYNVAASYYQN